MQLPVWTGPHALLSRRVRKCSAERCKHRVISHCARVAPYPPTPCGKLRGRWSTPSGAPAPPREGCGLGWGGYAVYLTEVRLTTSVWSALCCSTLRPARSSARFCTRTMRSSRTTSLPMRGGALRHATLRPSTMPSSACSRRRVVVTLGARHPRGGKALLGSPRSSLSRDGAPRVVWSNAFNPHVAASGRLCPWWR